VVLCCLLLPALLPACDMLMVWEDYSIAVAGLLLVKSVDGIAQLPQ
jgi:hypothetical protein